MKPVKTLVMLLAAAAAVAGLVIFLSVSSGSPNLVWNLSQGGTLLLPLVVVAALLDSINPCAFSILLLTIAFLFSLGKMRGRILAVGGLYILGLFLVYLLIGLGIMGTLHLFNTPHFMAKVGAVILILFGLINLINEFFPKFPVKLKIPQAAHGQIGRLIEKGSLPMAFALGGLVGVCEFPCTGGPYLMVLGLLHDQATYLKGFGYLILYNLIFVLPLVIILAIASNRALLDKVQDWRRANMRGFRFWTSAAMIGLGLIISFL